MYQEIPFKKSPKYQGIKVLLTGGGGFIGTALQVALRREGADVVSPTRQEMDVKDAAACRECIAQAKPEIVFHLAANLSGRWSADDVFDVFQTNTAGTVHVFDACRHAGVKTVVSCGSADELNGGVNLYGVSRAAGTLWARGYSQFAGLNVGVARIFMVYGPDQNPSFFLPALVRSMLTGKTLDMSLGYQTRDYTWLDDIVESLLLLGLKSDLRGATYQVCTGVETSLRDLVAMAEEITGKTAPVNFGALPYRRGEPFRLFGDPSKLMEGIGYRPSTTLRQGLERLLLA